MDTHFVLLQYQNNLFRFLDRYFF